MEYSKEFLELIDGLSDEQIEQAKENSTILRYCDEWLQDVVELALPEDTRRYHGDKRWCNGCEGNDRDSAYRLDREFKRPEKKAGRWVECDVRAGGGFYVVSTLNLGQMFFELNIHECASVVGFGGFQFEGQADSAEWHMGCTSFMDDNGNLCDVENSRCGIFLVAIPIKARFWVEQ